MLLSRWQRRQGGRRPRGAADRRAGDRQVAHPADVARAGARDEAGVLRYYCSPFYVHSALHPVLDQLERAAGLKKTIAQGQAREAGGAARPGLREVARAAALLAPLLSIPTGGRYPPLDLAPERKKALMLGALLEQLAGMAARPVLIMLEDAHWIDPTSTELFQLIIDRIQRLPVLLIIAFRPRLHAALDRLSAYHLAVALAPQPSPGGRAGRQGDPRPPAAGRGGRADRQADRWRAALRRGADQDPARIRAVEVAGDGSG